MQIKAHFFIWGMNVHLLLPWILQMLVAACAKPGPPSTAILLNANPVNVQRASYHPYRVVNRKRSPPFYDYTFRNDDEYYDTSEPTFSETDSFSIEAEDAVVGTKFSPPIIEHHPQTNIPFSHHSYGEKFMPPPYSTTASFQTPPFNYDRHRKSSTIYPFTKNYGHSVLRAERDSIIHEATVTSDYKVEDELLNDQPATDQKPHLIRNNFTDRDDVHFSVPSETILKIQPSANSTESDDRHYNNRHRPNGSRSVPTTVNYSSQDNSTIVPFIESETLLKGNREVPTYLGTQSPNISTQLTTATKATIDFSENTTTPDSFDVKENVSDTLPPVQSSKTEKLSAGALAGIIIAILSGVTVFTSSVIYLLYRKFNGKCTSVVEGKFNSDNCGYLDDSLRSSVYLNNHIELPKENSEEMTSLDNDSFLNSLETMTIQNYWADNTKNTKV